MPTVHLISGLPCSGKSTFARDLEHTTSALRLSLDEWLVTLFGADMLLDEPCLRIERVAQCRSLIGLVASRAVSLGFDVILDDGFFKRVTREVYRDLSIEWGAVPLLYYCSAPLTVLKERLRSRNVALPPHTFRISEQLLDQFAIEFEPPTTDEGMTLRTITT
jgi:predicted kinase